MTASQIQLIPGNVKSATQGCKSSDLWKLTRDRIVVQPGFNVRDKDVDYQARVRVIADSIKAFGYQQDRPITVFVAQVDGRDVGIVVDGHTRIDAVDLAISEGVAIETIPAITKPRGTSMEDLAVGLVTSNAGERLKPMEIARVVKRLLGFGVDDTDIAKRLGFTIKYVRSLLDLLAAPSDIRKMVANGEVSAGTAIDVLRKHKGEALAVLQAGKEVAAANGKEKMTPKHIKAASAVKSDKLDRTSELKERTKLLQDVTNSGELTRGITWIVTKAPEQRKDFVALLAHTFGVSETSVSDSIQVLACSVDSEKA